MSPIARGLPPPPRGTASPRRSRRFLPGSLTGFAALAAVRCRGCCSRGGCRVTLAAGPLVLPIAVWLRAFSREPSLPGVMLSLQGDCPGAVLGFRDPLHAGWRH